jgi:Peptidase family M48
MPRNRARQLASRLDLRAAVWLPDCEPRRDRDRRSGGARIDRDLPGNSRSRSGAGGRPTLPPAGGGAQPATFSALVIDDERPQPFCAGLIRPCVCGSTGAVELLDDLGLEAVLAHERHHARRRDPLRLATGRVLAQALFLLPGLRALIDRDQSLAELGADESAVNAAPANRSGLAGAMLSFSDAAVTGYQAGIDPTRADYLLGESPSWRFPLALCMAAAAGIALLLAIALLAVYGRRVRTRWARRSAWPPP